VLYSGASIRCEGSFQSTRYLEEHGLRFDTRDMYRPWSAARYEHLADALRSVGDLGVGD
jgi:hypothetical protein